MQHCKYSGFLNATLKIILIFIGLYQQFFNKYLFFKFISNDKKKFWGVPHLLHMRVIFIFCLIHDYLCNLNAGKLNIQPLDITCVKNTLNLKETFLSCKLVPFECEFIFHSLQHFPSQFRMVCIPNLFWYVNFKLQWRWISR